MQYEITTARMERFSNGEGEIGFAMEGYKFGSECSLTWSETALSGGRPLHSHGHEELHVIPLGQVVHQIGDELIESERPCVVRIPASVPHTFTAIGSSGMILGFMPDSDLMSHYVVVGPSPFEGGTSDGKGCASRCGLHFQS